MRKILLILCCPLALCGSITVIPSCASNLPSGYTNQVYAGQIFTASGGTAPYTFSVTPSSGSLPTGINITTFLGNGSLSGTPTAAVVATFKIRATDHVGATGDTANTCTLPVYAVQLAWVTTSLPGAYQGQSAY